MSKVRVNMLLDPALKAAVAATAVRQHRTMTDVTTEALLRHLPPDILAKFKLDDAY